MKASAPTFGSCHLPLKLAELLTADPPKPDWLIEDLIHKQQFVITAGEAGVGKSFFWYTAAFAVATGQQFIGRKVAQGRVLYFDDENSLPELRAYLHLIWCAFGKPALDHLEANLTIEHFALSAAGDNWPTVMSGGVAAHQPALVIIDTASSCLSVEDENDNAEAGRIVRNLRRAMSQGPQNAVLSVLKHAKEGRMRGAKNWEGMCDQILIHSRFKGKQRKGALKNTKLHATKRRAFGLAATLKITPVLEGSCLRLKSEAL